MTPLREFFARISSALRRDHLKREFDDELASHLEMLIDDARQRGLSEVDARYEALRKLGQPVSLREQHHDARGFPLFDALVNDSRFAIRMLLKTPAFTVVVTLTLALGIGANTALFSIVDNLLLRSLPVRDPDRLVQMQVVQMVGSVRNDKPLASLFDRATFEAVRAQSPYIADVVGFRQMDRPTITVAGEVEPTREVQMVSPNFFSGLGVSPIAGRPPSSSEDNVAVISARWWQTRFGGREDVIGRVLEIEGKNHTIIGVAPARFHGFDVDRSADIWISTTSEELSMIAFLQPGVTPAQAEVAVHPLLREAVDREYQSEPMQTYAQPVGKGLSGLRDQYKGALLALAGLVTLVLLTTCANVGNLIMLRNAARRRELTVRAALGAGRSRLMVQSLVESTLLAAVGCMGGLLLAAWGVSIIVSLLPLPAPPDGLTFHADARVVGFAAGVSVLCVFLYGLGPAWRATNVNLVDALRSGPALSAPKRTRRLGRVLVGGQVALSVLLLVGAGLFVQTLRNLSRLDMGFRTERLLQVSIDTRYAGYEKDDVVTLSNLLYERIGAVPGVRSTTRTRSELMQGSSGLFGVPLPGLDRTTLQMWDAVEVGPEFFETMGIEAVRGRTFTTADFRRDGADLSESLDRATEATMAEYVRSAGPYVINEAFAKHYAPDADPLGPASPIVGIVKNVKLLGVKGEVQPLMFLPSRKPDEIRALQVRTVGDSHVLERTIREAIQAVHPRLFLGITTLSEASNQSIAKERMVAVVSGFFGLLGLSLACVGIFGVAAGAVTHRTKELGIRRALGASGKSVIWACLRETLVVLMVGLIIGAVCAAALVRVSASVVNDLLFGITATDITNLITAIALMVLVALAACTLPALRATRIDPLAVLKEE